MSSKFNLDSEFERASIEYLKIKNPFKELDISSIIWTDNKEEQLNGSDLVATVVEDGCIMPNRVIDVKSVASLIPTFSQEIINANSERVGWIMNNDLKTDFLLYVWHEVEANNYSEGKKKVIESISNIKSTHLSLCNKKDMQDLIYKEIGIRCTPKASRFILSEIKRINSDKPTSYYTVDIENKCLKEISKNERENVYITYSRQVHEKPINFVVRKNLIEKISKNTKIS